MERGLRTQYQKRRIIGARQQARRRDLRYSKRSKKLCKRQVRRKRKWKNK